MRIIVTGGAGFIGSWVCEAYIGEGHEVLVVDDLSTGFEGNIPPEADFVECDVRDFGKLGKTFREFRPQVVNHHAAQINVRSSVENPSFDAEVNVVGSLNVLRLCAEHETERFVFASTGGALYGEPEKLPAGESAAALPISPYGIAKLSAENYARYHSRTFGTRHAILRYANVYGERQNPEGEAGVIAIFCRNAMNGKPCVIFGDGNQTRDYVHVSDVSAANVLATRADEGTFNIGTSVETSVNDIARVLGETAGTGLEVVYRERRSGEVERISLDSSLAAEKLGWTPRTGFREGILRTWKWFSERPKAEPMETT